MAMQVDQVKNFWELKVEFAGVLHKQKLVLGDEAEF